MSYQPRRCPCSRFFKIFRLSNFYLQLEEELSSATGTNSWPIARMLIDCVLLETVDHSSGTQFYIIDGQSR